MRKYLLVPAVLAFSGLAAPSHAAITLKLDGYKVGDVTNLEPDNYRTMQWQVLAGIGQLQLANGDLVKDNAGQFGGTIDLGEGAGSQSFAAYCVELSQGFLTFPTSTPLTYTAESGDTYFAGGVSTNVGKLYSQGIVFDTAEKTAAFQIALWEVIHEKSGTFAVGDGSLAGNADFTTYTGSTASAATYTLAQGYLDALPGTVNSVLLTVYKNENFQNLIVATPVPEPSVAATMLAGLAGIGLFGAMRARRQG